ncbi:MAG: hypothetical protein NW223_03840 [Hyphomicrobiaceae bacterium]|nr:hypothetical protein [Hyphomicrobiaceae bacterium]
MRTALTLMFLLALSAEAGANGAHGRSVVGSGKAAAPAAAPAPARKRAPRYAWAGGYNFPTIVGVGY